MERISGKIKRAKRRLRDSGLVQKLMAAVFIASTVLTPITPVYAATAQDTGPETATVTLTETVNGTLSFEGTDQMSKTVEVGTEVTVLATADEGYFADSLSVFTSDTEAEAVEVKDGKATFTVNGDVTVTAAFYENGSAGSAALEPVEVKEQRSGNIASVEQYVRENMDPQYVGELADGSDLTRADMLHVTTTVVDGSQLPEGTLDALWADDDGDGLSDHWEAMISHGLGYAILFEADPDADYYVAWVGADIEGAKLTDWAAAENNADANMRDGFIMDEATGLVYVPKSYTTYDDDGTLNALSSRMQLVYTAQDASAEAAFDIAVDSAIEDDGIARSGKVSASVSSPYTNVVLAGDEDARAALRSQSIDSVTVNGIEYDAESGMWSYDAETGAIELHIAPQSIHVLTVSLSNSILKDVAAFFGITPRAFPASQNILGTWEFTTAPKVGGVIRANATVGYDGDGVYTDDVYGDRLNYWKMPATDVEHGMENDGPLNIARKALGLENVNLSGLFITGHSLMRYADTPAQTVSGSNSTVGTVKIPQRMFISLVCSHVGINDKFQIDSDYNHNNEGYEYSGKVQFRIMSVSGNTAIVGVVVPTSFSQAGGGFYKIKWKLGEGGIRLTKESASPDISEGNPLYSIEGAVYGVYSDASCTKLVTKLTVDEDGKAEYWGLSPATYYVKEITAPEGFFLDTSVHKVTVPGGSYVNVTVEDVPAGDPAVVMVGKYDGEKTYSELDGNMPQGSASLAGAEFTIEYYDTLDYDDYDSLKEAGVEPTRSWVIKTDDSGYARLSESYLVSGDELFYFNGQVQIPRGTLVMYESKAPEGYILNEDYVSFQKIQEATDPAITYNTAQAPEEVIRGGVSIQKVDASTGTTPEGGASLAGIEFSIINDNENDVIVGGETFAPGEVVMTITTDDDGRASTGADALPYGSFTIRESKTNDTFLNTSDDMHVTISEDGKVYEFTAADEVVRGGVEITKRDIESDLSTPLGGAASFDGVTFEVTSLNDNPVVVGGLTYGKGDVVATLTIKDGYAATAERLLPAGDYALQEAEGTEGYNLNGKVYEFTIAEDGVLVNPATAEDGHIHNQVKRSDLEFTKKSDTTAERLAAVAFKVTSQTTGESHVIVTDENGYFSSASSWNKHSSNTNGNDWALDADGVIDSSQLDMTAGTWFGLASDGNMTAADDARGAFPYDTYTIEELRCTANEGYTLVKTSVTITRDGVTYDFGTLDDVQPEISTTAYDPVDGDKRVPVGEVTIADKVTYSGLAEGEEYTLVTTVVDAETGDAITVDGKPVSATTAFTASGTTGHEVVEMTLPTYELGGRTITVFEELYFSDGTLAASHLDKDDVDQQLKVIVPEIGTTATDGADGDKTVSTDTAVNIVDTVSYKNLAVGKEYTVTGTLYDKATGEALEVDGKAVTAEATFTPETADGTVEVTFTFDSTALDDGTQLVAFETLSQNGRELAVHADIEDMNQTVTIENPTIGTTAVDGVDGDKNVVTDSEATVVDTVSYDGLVPGKEYTVTGTLMDKATGEPLEVDGKAVTAETTFTAEKSSGTVNVTFTFDSRALESGTQLVAFESLSQNGNELVAHEDIEDVNQTVTVTPPSIGTTAVDGADGDKNVVVDDAMTIRDTVTYHNLVPGREYTVKGTLHIKGTDEDGNVTETVLTDAEGNPVTAETTFTPDSPDGMVDVTFTFDGRAIPDKTEVVAFESLEQGGVELAVHADINDENQTTTVTHPTIGTTAVDGADGDKNVVCDSESTIVDTVEYKNVVPGKEYTVTGTLYDKATGEALEVDGKAVTAQATFTPETADGTVEVTFTFDSRAIEAGTQLVVFETLEQGGIEIAVHADIEDEAQTVTITHPTIGTTAVDGHDGDKTVVTDGTTTIVDTVEYKNVVPGREYTVKGTLHIKGTDAEGNVTETVLTDAEGNPVTAETTFTPEERSGSVEVTFTFDSTAVPHGTEIVAFESLEQGGIEIAVHADIEDENQTTDAHVTGVGTTASDGLDGDKTVVADGETVITDEVAYTDAMTGTEYTVAGMLMDADTGLPILAGDGSEKYTDADVAAFMAKLLDALGLSAEVTDGYITLPVSESTEGHLTTTQAVHIHDDGTYEVITVTTGTDEYGLSVATMDSTGPVSYDELDEAAKAVCANVVVLKDAGIILDYSGVSALPANADMAAVSQLLADNADLVDHMVFQTASVTPEEYDGTVSMNFAFDSNAVIDRLSGETKDVVVFELMFKGSLSDDSAVIVASETDLGNEGQTVKLVPSTIGTTATDASDGDHELMPGKDAVITDTVAYHDLIPGREYTLKATLYDKATGEPLSVNDKHVTAEIKFTPNSPDGTIDIDLGPFDATALDGHDLVVFEELYKQAEVDGEVTDVLVAEHKDINDEAQTVTVTSTPTGGRYGKTGGDNLVYVLVALVLIGAAGCLGAYGFKARRTAKAGEAATDDAAKPEDGSGK